MDTITLTLTDSFAITGIGNLPLELTADHATYPFACNEKIYRMMGLYADHESYMAEMADKRDIIWFEKKITIYADGRLELWIGKHDGEGIVSEVLKEAIGSGADAIKKKLSTKVIFPSKETEE